MEPNHPDRAFTLVELMVVVAILGILASVVVPRLGGSASTWRSDRFAHSIWSSLRNAKFKSYSNDQPIVVRFKLKENGKIRFFTETGGTWHRDPGLPVINLPDSVWVNSVGEDSPHDDGGYVCVEFEPNGDVSKAYPVSSTDMKCVESGSSSIGEPIIHLSPAHTDFTGGNQCDFSTIYIEVGRPNSQPYLMNFGAYDEFSPTELGDSPC